MLELSYFYAIEKQTRPFIMRKTLLALILFNLLALTVAAQFYNGHQMQFGKNRVQFNNFYWNYFRYDRFDMYFNEGGTELAKYASEFAAKELSRVESIFDYNIDNRIIFVMYNKLSDFRQSNIGLITGTTENNIGGTFRIEKNKAFLFYEGDFEKLEQQITAAISQVLINEMVYGLQFRDNAANSTLINLPQWYVDGLVAYLSKGWDFETENKVKDGIVSGKYKKFNRLQGEDAAHAGHSFWKYISDVYGESVIPSILYLTKVNKNANSGFFYVVGASLKDLSAEWYYYYSDIYSEIESTTEAPATAPLKKRPRKNHVYQNMQINSTGNYISYVTNHMGKYKIWLYNTSTGKHKKILRREHKLEQITDYTYPVMAWHPSGRILTFIIEEKGRIVMYYYTFGERKMTKRNILYFDKIMDYSFSEDGSLIVLSGVKDGKTDIFVHSIAAGTNFQVTNDIADDFFPKFINNGSHIIFASNRSSDSLDAEMDKSRRGLTQDLFIYDYANRSNKLMRLADEKYVKKSRPFEVSRNKFISLNNQTGIVNRYMSEFDSTISFVDTTVHYRYFAETQPISNVKRNIIEQNYNKESNLLSEVIYDEGKYFMYMEDFDVEGVEVTEPPKTDFRIAETKKLRRADSINRIPVVMVTLDSLYNNQIVSGEDTVTIEMDMVDINNYIFEIERIAMYNEQFRSQDIHIEVVEEEVESEKKKLIYQKAFYQNYVVGQIDFGFLSQSYQTFTGGAVYFNPGMNLAFKLGTQDLFEDYKITAGLRLPLDFQSSEYLIGFETLKKRLNKQLFYHRQTFNNQSTDDIPFQVKNITNQVFGVFRYPFSQVTSVSATVGGRLDKTIYQSAGNSFTVQEALKQANIEKLWLNLKTEYVFDNTRSLGLNLPGGTRFKLFAEAYQMVNTPYDNLFVAGGDFRNYIQIHRNLIWANRLAFSGSTGSAALIYYLGGVDNWTNFSSRTPTFIPLSEIRITDNRNYAFQTVATNMRGFSQNIRNGSNFALINSELRWPIVRYIANYPLSNAFLENLQVIGFFDIGTAWTGVTPWSKENGYDLDVIYQGSLSSPTIIEIDAQRDPVVAGYGFGVRSQVLGYFVRLDWAWGIENQQVLPRVFYFSLALDF